MGTKYSTVTVSGYNSSAPSDDGSQTAANQVTWAKSKTKLGDPLKTAIESINTALVTALDSSVRAVTSTDSTVAGDHLKTIQCTVNSAGITLSLGDAATMAAGYIVTVANSGASTGDVTVALATSTNLLNSVTNGTRVVPAGAALTFIVASPATGYNIVSDNNLLHNPTYLNVAGVMDRVVGRTTTDTLTNKTLTSPTINGATIATSTLTSPVINTAVTGTAIASGAQMETATAVDVLVTPGRQQYHPSAAKGWARYDAAGNIGISSNVSSITDHGTGDQSVVWNVDFSSAVYVPVGMAEIASNTGMRVTVASSGTAAGTTRILTHNASENLADAAFVYVVAFGDQ